MRDGGKPRTLKVSDEFCRGCLFIRVDPRLGSADVINRLADLFIGRGRPSDVRW
jgi:hypothetical protein